MYIRRKVFSVALDEYGEERYFSTNEFLNEDSYLDEIMYSSEDLDTVDKAALATTGVGAAAAAGGHLLRRHGVNQATRATVIPGLGPLVKRKDVKSMMKGVEKVAGKVPGLDAALKSKETNLAGLIQKAKEAGLKPPPAVLENYQKFVGWLKGRGITPENLKAAGNKYIGEDTVNFVKKELQDRGTSVKKGLGNFMMGKKVRNIGLAATGIGAAAYGASRLSNRNRNRN